jgi:peroxiredoxin 2/4
MLYGDLEKGLLSLKTDLIYFLDEMEITDENSLNQLKEKNMKTTIRKIVLVAIFFFAITQLWSQGWRRSRIPLIGENAPSFTAQSTNGTISFPGDFGNKWKILFSHPADFTPVCTSEIIELAQMQQTFKDLNVELAVVSTDPLFEHQSWVKSMEEIMEKGNKPVKINFPIIDDSQKIIGWKYGMLTSSHESFKAVRGVFIIDPKNKVRAVYFYPNTVGRNLAEIERTVIALQLTEKNTVLTPVNWKPGEDVLLPYPMSVDYYDPMKAKDPSLYDISWYMFYKKLAINQ